MISLDTKAEVKSASVVTLSTPDEKSTKKGGLSFGELLKGIKVPTDTKDSKLDSKIVQNGVLILALDEKEMSSKLNTKDSKTDSLLSLLKGEEKVVSENKEPIEFHPKITENLSPKEVKVLVSDAKDYLKQQIMQSDGYKKSQIKELPQTLKGLTQVAQKFGIDVSKITLEQVQAKPQTQTLAEVKQIQQTSEKDIDIEEESSSTKKLLKTADIDEAVDIKQEVKSDRKSTKTLKGNENIPQVNIKDDVKADVKTDIKTEQIAKVNSTAEFNSTPLFKAQSVKEVTTTEQIVLAKQFKPVEEKTPKDRADETLKLLLRGEKPSHSNANLTADFSVATAKVIAPKTTTEATKSLEALLRGDSPQADNTLKTEQMSVHKSDSFEVKLNEAKQMVKYLSQDVKTAIDDYKSPFTRVKVQLNPQKLGEVELTVVQRGKNLHVNISSNTVAVNTLAMNLNELKTQLSNSGINNATFNFNSGSENGSSNNGQQQNARENQQQANDEYNYFENEEHNEEILSSLEIVVPSYA